MFFSPENALADFRKKVKEVWNIPEKIYYWTINGVHESRILKQWTKITAVQVKVKGLFGGGRTGTLTLIIDEEECRCKTNQTFREVIEDRDLEIRGDSLISIEEGSFIDIDDKIGSHFEAGMAVPLTWNDDDEEVSYDPNDPYKDSIKLNYCLDGESRLIVVGRDRTMRSFMDDNWEEIDWVEFRNRGGKIDPDTPLIGLVDDQMNVSIEILTQQDLEREREFVDEQALLEDDELEEPKDESDEANRHLSDEQPGRGEYQSPRSGSGVLDGHSGQDLGRSDDSYQVDGEERNIESTPRKDRPLDDGPNSSGRMGENPLHREIHMGPGLRVETKLCMEVRLGSKRPSGGPIEPETFSTSEAEKEALNKENPTLPSDEGPVSSVHLDIDLPARGDNHQKDGEEERSIGESLATARRPGNEYRKSGNSVESKGGFTEIREEREVLHADDEVPVQSNRGVISEHGLPLSTVTSGKHSGRDALERETVRGVGDDSEPNNTADDLKPEPDTPQASLHSQDDREFESSRCLGLARILEGPEMENQKPPGRTLWRSRGV
jgi:hypothetical protein